MARNGFAKVCCNTKSCFELSYVVCGLFRIKKHTLKIGEYMSPNQPLNSELPSLTPFRAFLDNACTETTHPQVEVWKLHVIPTRVAGKSTAFAVMAIREFH